MRISLPVNCLSIKWLCIVFLLVFTGQALKSQISITAYQSPYYQNFNTLSNSGTASNVPQGWSFYETGGSAATYLADNGNNTGGNTYSYGATGSVERSFGSIRTGTVNTIIGAKFINNTGGVITRFIVEYTGEQWRIGNIPSNDRMDFQYSTTATYLHGTIGWVDFDELDFASPVTASTTATALNGNDPANRTALKR
jgi:trimeric autotransporter adhesin